MLQPYNFIRWRVIVRINRLPISPTIIVNGNHIQIILSCKPALSDVDRGKRGVYIAWSAFIFTWPTCFYWKTAGVCYAVLVCISRLTYQL